MIVGPDSVLRRIPMAMARQQALFIEGIRFSIEMADLANTRLQGTLPLLSRMVDLGAGERATVSAMADSWSIVDSLHRLRGLMRQMPGIPRRNRIPPIRAFFGATERVTELRNTVQHLDTTIPAVVADQNWAVWGSLSWCLVDPVTSQITSSCFIPGTPLGRRPLINPANRAVWHFPIDAITIERSGVSVCLSDAMRRVEAMARSLETALTVSRASQLPDQGQHGADVTLSLVFALAPERVVPPDTPDPEPTLPPEDADPAEVG
jgi:hypothetical protein